MKNKNCLKNLGNYAIKGRKMDDITKNKISNANKGTKQNYEWIKKRQDARKGWKHSEETKMNLSIIHKGNKYNLGKHHTEEAKRKMSEIMKGKHNSPNTEFKKGMKWKEETKEKMINTQKKIKPKYDTGKRQSYKEIPMSHYIWCINNNIHRIPLDCVIHHIDGNRENNNITNLVLIQKGLHIKLHNEYNKMLRQENCI